MNKHLWGLNPEVRELFKKKPTITIIGLMWASTWRLYLAMFAGYFVLLAGVLLIGYMVGSY